MILKKLENLRALLKDGPTDSFCKLYAEIKVYELLNPGEIEKLGWVECIFSNTFFPKEESVTAFANYSNFTKNIPFGIFNKGILAEQNYSKYVYFDEINKCYLLFNCDRPASVIANLTDDAFSTTSGSFAQSRAHSSRVSRDVNIFHFFESYFKNHEPAVKKGYIKPEGEAFGIEIETKFATVFSKLRFSNYVGVNFPGWICERDGSLEDKGRAGDCGLELVSPPLPYNKLLTQLEPILKEARSQKGIGHEAGVFYGIHLNVNIYGDNKPHTAKRLICLINDPQLRIFWETLSRRRGSLAMQDYCQFQNVLYDTCLSTESYNHYRAAYYRTNKDGTASNCVEVRIFRSNLRFISVKITVEIIKLALDFSMSKADINDYVAFREFLLSNASKELSQYIHSSDCAAELDRAARYTNERKYKTDLKEFAD